MESLEKKFPIRILREVFLCQGRKRNPNPNFLVRIFSGRVGVFHVNGWGPKSSVCPSKPGKSNFFSGISRDFAGISWRRPKSLRKKSLCSILVPYCSNLLWGDELKRLWVDCSLTDLFGGGSGGKSPRSVIWWSLLGCQARHRNKVLGTPLRTPIRPPTPTSDDYHLVLSGRINPYPSDTKLLLTKHFCDIFLLQNLRIARVIPCKSLSFLEMLRVQNPLKITKTYSQGVIFVVISCQKTVRKPDFPY